MSMEHKPQIVNDNRLGCPLCGGEYLHHGRVIVKNRCEDREGTIASTDFEVTTVHAAHKNEFEGRRSSVWIEMWCEHCKAGVVGWVGFVQHKGNTVVEWHKNAPIGVDDNERESDDRNRSHCKD